MMTLVVYDITDDALRSKVAELLKDQGLKRVQKSAFLGQLTQQEREDLAFKLSRLPLGGSDRIDIFPVCDRDLKLHISIRRGLVQHGAAFG